MRESEVTRVVRKQRPFFVGYVSLRKSPNKLGIGRFAIILSGKVCRNSICRNYFRRSFYRIVLPYTSSISEDIVFQASKVVLDYKNPVHIQIFQDSVLKLLTQQLGKIHL